MVHVYTDGGSRGNPGEAASGIYICDDKGNELASLGIRLGITTNNVAEYTAVIKAYDWLLTHKEILANSPKVSFFMDSQLVASQLKGIYKVKHPGMQQLFLQVQAKERQLGKPVSYTHIPREQNKKADSMVNAALDNLL